MNPTHIKKAKAHLEAALALLDGSDPSLKGRNPEWFRDTGHLSDAGIAHLLSLFAKGKSSYAIAKEMHLSYRAVSVRHDQWRKKNPGPAAWLRQDGR